MTEVVRSIHLPGAAALDSLRERAAVALNAWAREWVSGGLVDELSTLPLRVGPTTDFEQSQAFEYEALRTEEGCMWFRRSHVDRAQLGRTVVGPESMSGIAGADPWMEEVIDQALNARDRALCSALLSTPLPGNTVASVSAPPAELFAFGSGAVELSCGLLGLHAIADQAVWRATPPAERGRGYRRPKATPLDMAVRQAKARLEVVLGSVEVELPKLLDLRCGDVLRLPQRLDQAIAVLCEGKPLSRAALGERQGRKCVQLLPDHQ